MLHASFGRRLLRVPRDARERIILPCFGVGVEQNGAR